jgi:hypothetical protein
VIIDGVRRPSPPPTGPLRSALRGFSVAMPTERPPSVAPTASALPLDGMLALQEQEADAIRDREAHRHGRALLQALSTLQQAVLSGCGEEASLHHLAALAEGLPAAANPGLAAAIQALALRARVELARRDL